MNRSAITSGDLTKVRNDCLICGSQDLECRERHIVRKPWGATSGYIVESTSLGVCLKCRAEWRTTSEASTGSLGMFAQLPYQKHGDRE
jgi:hypothetical protein